MDTCTSEQSRRIACKRCPKCNIELKRFVSKYNGREMLRCPKCGENISYAFYKQCERNINNLNSD